MTHHFYELVTFLETVLCIINVFSDISFAENLDEPPPVHGDWEVNLVPRVFNSARDYCNSFYPLLMHELWQSVFDDYLENKATPNAIQCCATDKPRDSQCGKVVWFIGLLTQQEKSYLEDTYQGGWLVSIGLRLASSPPSGAGPPPEKGTRIKSVFANIESAR